jgi:peptidoglycan-associated lipoprotein
MEPHMKLIRVTRVTMLTSLCTSPRALARWSARTAALAVCIGMAACSSSIKLEDPPAEGTGTGAEINARSGQTPGASGTGLGSERPIAQVTLDAASKEPWNDPKNPLSKRSIYFDFDSFTIRDEYRSVIETHSRYLLANKSRKVIIQGNTDERGSREYNIALGQKRAEAVRRALTSLGVGEAQLEAVSLGEEKPKATGADDTSLAENRRADIVYQ